MDADLNDLINTLQALIPPKYLGLFLALMMLLRALDAVIRLIPDRYLAAHTTEQAAVNAWKAVWDRLLPKSKAAAPDAPPPPASPEPPADAPPPADKAA